METIFMVLYITVLCMFAVPGMLLIAMLCIFLKQKETDDSNIINYFRLIWFVSSKPHKIIDVFPWIANDEGVNMRATNKELRKKKD